MGDVASETKAPYCTEFNYVNAGADTLLSGQKRMQAQEGHISLDEILLLPLTNGFPKSIAGI
jgi:hypothetical protein